MKKTLKASPSKPKRANGSTGLYPEHALRGKSRHVRPSVEAMREALIASNGRYGLASIKLQCAEKSLRDWARQEGLTELVDELREIQIDRAESVLDQILNNPKHPRQFDCARYLTERLGRQRGYGFKITHENHVEVKSSFVPISDREFQPEAWDADEHARWAELHAIPHHQLTADNLAEIQSLVKRARVIELPAIEDHSDGDARNDASLSGPALRTL